MSNYLSVATVSAAIGYVLRGVSQVVDGADITYERPDRLEARSLPVEAGVNLYLYRTRTDASFRNQDLPTRGDNGQAVQRPVAPLSLNYLVTFFGDDSKFEPQRLLGWTSSTLHAHPLLTPDDISGAIAAYPAILTGSDLAAQPPRVTITPLELTLEDLSKVWSVFVAAPYLLSVAYEAGVVLVNPEEPPPPSSLPVLRRNLVLVSTDHPSIVRITPQWVPPGGTLTIIGKCFGQLPVVLDFSGTRVALTPESPTTITCRLPSTLPAGVNGLTVSTQVNTGSPQEPQLRPIARSNVAAFVVLPTITSISCQPGMPPVIQVLAEPLIGPQQDVVLWLTELAAADSAPRRYGLHATTLTAPSGSLAFRAAGVASGTYMARLYVDQAESQPGDQVVVP